jgi:hypothetical protein
MRKIFLIAAILLPLVLAEPVLAADPHLTLSPASGSYSGSLELQIKINTGGKAAGGVDIYLDFPKDKLSAASFTGGTAFPKTYSLIKNAEGKWRISGWFPLEQAGESFNGADGLVGTAKFTVLEAGNAAVTFVCTPGQTNETNIVEKTVTQDVVVCSANVGGAYTLATGGSSPTATPTPGPTNTPGARTPTATPTMPATGIDAPTIGLLGLGILAVLTGLVLAF